MCKAGALAFLSQGASALTPMNPRELHCIEKNTLPCISQAVPEVCPEGHGLAIGRESGVTCQLVPLLPGTQLSKGGMEFSKTVGWQRRA